MKFKLKSEGFNYGEKIPDRYTCQGSILKECNNQHLKWVLGAMYSCACSLLSTQRGNKILLQVEGEERS